MTKLSQNEIQKLLKQWSENVPARALIKEYHMSYGKIQQIVADHGYDLKRLNRTGSKNNMWKGGRFQRSSGYVDVYAEEGSPFVDMAHRRDHVKNRAGYIPEHRLVMAKHLNRPLMPYESVHHKNGIKNDNRIENLQLRMGKHGTGICLTCADCGSKNILSEEI